MKKISGMVAAGIALALSGPVMASAPEVKFSGRVALDLVVKEDGETTRSWSDNGTARLQVDASQETGAVTFFGRLALDMRDRVKSEGQSRFGPEYRERYVGVRGAYGELQAGRMAGALKNAEADPYITTFLEARNTVAVGGGAYGSNTFVNDMLQYSNSFAGVNVLLQYNPTTDSDADSINDAAVLLSGTLGTVDLWAGWNNARDSGNDNAKFGARTKFGKVAVTAQYELRDGWTESSSALLFGDRVFVMADMPFANGFSGNLALGLNTDSDDSWARLAVNKAFTRQARVYTGVTFTNRDAADNVTLLGVGAELRF